MNFESPQRGVQFAREARLGMTVIAILLVVFAWATIRRFSTTIPDTSTDLRAEGLARFANEKPPLQPQARNLAGSNFQPGPINPSTRINASAVSSNSRSSVFQQNPAIIRSGRDSSPAMNSGTRFSNPRPVGNPRRKPDQSRPQRRNTTKTQQEFGTGDVVVEFGQPTTADQVLQSQPVSDFQPSSSTVIDPLQAPIIDFGEETTPPPEVNDDLPVIEFGEETSAEQVIDPQAQSLPIHQSETATIRNLTRPPTDLSLQSRLPLISSHNQQTQTVFAEKDDSFWSISQRAYGTGHYHKALQEFNKARFKSRADLTAGASIYAPPISTLRKKYPHLVPENTGVDQIAFRSEFERPTAKIIETKISAPSATTFPTLSPARDVSETLISENLASPVAGQNEPVSSRSRIPPARLSLIPPTGTATGVDSESPFQSNPSVLQNHDIHTTEFISNPLNYSDAIPRLYAVNGNESLFDIARSQLLQASRYLEIIQLNRNVLPANVTHLTRLKEGTQLRLPSE